jgi:uncharacterized protein YndB with AHSA1/START domain
MRAARSVADLHEGTVHALVEIAAPPERVFRALASEEIARWWGSDDRYRVKKWTGDLRVGGAWKSEGLGSDGKPFSVSGEFLQVDAPKRLVHTWKYDWDPEQSVTTVDYRLDAIEGGTRVTVRHTGFRQHSPACLSHGDGWARVLNWLDEGIK